MPSTFIWEPFSEYFKNLYNIKRSIYKNIPGNKIIFEEENKDLGLVFSYEWMNSEQFGFVRKSKIVNKNQNKIEIEILDGIQNILPYGVYQKFQVELSTLIDGYKKNELIEELGIGIYTLSSIPSDKAEPSESLKATVVWSTGIDADKHLLSSHQISNFRSGKKLSNETNKRAAKGAYFVNSSFTLNKDLNKEWFIVSEINVDSSDLTKITSLLKNSHQLKQTIIDDVNSGTEKLINLVAASDGLQLTNDQLSSSRHFSNVLFNIMRGGIFEGSYFIDKNDFISFLSVTNKNVLKRNKSILEKFESKIAYSKLLGSIDQLNDSEFRKLAYEYLPLSFSRRHGDPSRPWNKFSIEIKDKQNKKLLNYEGNWRDIFQNWEALAISFPGFLESMITKFVNASTADGYNPYRVTRDGFDWEMLEPDVPWSNIGYWGDHQIIYLLKLLELSSSHNPAKLLSFLSEELFTYANVPYKIKNYHELLKDSKNTIEFDDELNDQILLREKEIGSDARFIEKSDGHLFQVNLTEKLLVTLLSKLSNFIPGGGIWMNTQRPEWNDANNALVGNGVSMVTLYYIRRYVHFLINVFGRVESKTFSFSEEVNTFFKKLSEVLNSNKHLLTKEISDKDRKVVLDGLGSAGSDYRESIYQNGFTSNTANVNAKEILNFLSLAQEYIEHTIKYNKRGDGLYNAYNLMEVEGEEIKIENLYEMLEGQVAVLSSGYLSTEDSIRLLESLRKSALYREDQNSYILYPDKLLPMFIDKNTIPESNVNSSAILKYLVDTGNEDIIKIDIDGKAHFNGEIRNSTILKERLLNLNKDEKLNIDENEVKEVLDMYELVFNHSSFTGRSGTFYKYEGLGCIYWHMVSKLVLAVQETYFRVYTENAAGDELDKLKEFYYTIKDGIGVKKDPNKYGAFPTDPYSHTPSFAGVQQPGLTGQVKEDVISRFQELGVQVSESKIIINPILLAKEEFLFEKSVYEYYDVNNAKQSLNLQKDSLAFTYCQVPFIYKLSDKNRIIVFLNDGKQIEFDDFKMNETMSQSIFNRDDRINRIEVKINR